MPIPSRLASAALTFLLLGFGSFGAEQVTCAEEPAESSQTARNAENDRKWTVLFDGKTLAGWKEADFPGKGGVSVEKEAIVLGTGMDMTGVNLDRKFPKVNYELELEANRLEGSDFFCGLTFPVRDEFCSLIVGGWGGGVVGLSSVNGFDASENETTGYRQFENGTWYPIRLRVTDQRITAWVDGKEMVDLDIRDQQLDTRIEVEWSKPFGISSWQTKSALRKLRFRELDPAEIRAVNAELPDE